MDQIQIVSTKPMSFGYALSINDLPKEETVILRYKFDLIGGQTVGIKTMAVTWGFGDPEALLYSPGFHLSPPLDILRH